MAGSVGRQHPDPHLRPQRAGQENQAGTPALAGCAAWPGRQRDGINLPGQRRGGKARHDAREDGRPDGDCPGDGIGVVGKGKLEVGVRCRLAVFNPNEERTVSFKDLATPAESHRRGREDEGLGGRYHLARRGDRQGRKFIGKTGRGRFIKCSIDRTE